MANGWTNIDASTLGPELAKAYQDYKDAYRYAAELKRGFETKVRAQAELPEGKKLVFAYNFGKLSVNIVDDDRPERKPAAATPTLAQFLAAQAANGSAS